MFNGAMFPILSCVVSAVVVLCVVLGRRFAIKRVMHRAGKDIDFTIARGLVKLIKRLSWIWGIYGAAYPFHFESKWSLWIYHGTVTMTLIVAYLAVSTVIDGLIGTLLHGKKDNPIVAFVPMIRQVIRLLIAVLFFLFILNVFGYRATTLIGALGLGSALGGAAIAFASKDTIANCLACFSLTLDRSFSVGERIRIGDKYEGTVEELGLRSTMIRTYEKTLLVIPNALLANEVIDNFSRRAQRRVRHTLGLVYSTTPQQIEALVEPLKMLLCSDPDVVKDDILVGLENFGDSSLDVLVQYFTTNGTQEDYLRACHRINLNILKLLESMGLEMAYPTHTVYLSSVESESESESERP